MTTKKVEEVLLRAAEIVEERWQQGSRGWCGGPRCMLGAIQEAAMGIEGDLSLYISNQKFVLYRSAALSVATSLPQLIAVWNDTPGRTKEQVAAKLREAAEKAKG